MGIGREVHEFEEDALKAAGLEWTGIRMCELGNQKIKFLKHRIPAKKYYTGLGVKEHVSLDLNAKNGARPVNLDKSIPQDLLNRFMLVTDYGTLEHVNNQYQVFRNMHDMCCIDGIMLHSLPPPGHWPGHGRYYYPEEFFEQLARTCGYSFVIPMRRQARDNREEHDMLMVAFRKTKDNFPARSAFHALPIEDSGDMGTTGNYTQKNKPIGRIVGKIRSAFN